jgi:hypothetical protein|tara:strand:+ start:1082 stop:1567 length:486 start_codon:yes stop_codon:yes gene_type:complete
MRITLALALSLALLTGCNTRETRAQPETAAQCVERFENLGGDRLAMAMPDDRLVQPVYIYDMSGLPSEQFSDLLKEKGEGIQFIMASSDSSKAQAEFVATGTDQRKVIFHGENATLLKLRGKAGPVSQIRLAGCERTSDGMRLISIHQFFIPPNASSDPES